MYDQEHGQDNIFTLQLELGLSFPNWQLFKVWLDQFALQEGFNYKIRNSETDEGIVRRINYVCAKSAVYNPKITAEPTKR
jgi:hypothetical protein